MKKILFMLILLIPFIVCAEYDESKITIESFGMSSHEGHGSENASAVINGKNVNFNYVVSDVGDKITFDMVIKNESGEDIEVYNRLDKSNYIDYMLISPDLDYVVKNNSTKTFQLVVEYVNQVSEEALASGSIRDDKTYTLEVSDEIGRNADALGIDDVTHEAVDPTPTSVPKTVDNPDTKAVKDILAIVCIIFVISIGLFLILRRKNRIGKLFVIVGLIGIITPIVVYAYKEFNISLKATVIIQKPKNEPVVEPVYVCKKAKTLHTKTCNGTTYGCNYIVGNGNVITYGSLVNGTVKAGDAYDCDVNNDGVYNAETERFYYVTHKDNKAVLIYYKNIAVAAYYVGSENWHGPTALYQQLPDDTVWSNPNLITPGSTRVMNELSTYTTSNGEHTIDNFSYGNKVARVLTTNDVKAACNLSTITDAGEVSGGLDSCYWLFENTNYFDAYSDDSFGIWLENPQSFNANKAWAAQGFYRNLSGRDISKPAYGVRPVITIEDLYFEK